MFPGSTGGGSVSKRRSPRPGRFGPERRERISVERRASLGSRRRSVWGELVHFVSVLRALLDLVELVELAGAFAFGTESKSCSLEERHGFGDVGEVRG